MQNVLERIKQVLPHTSSVLAQRTSLTLDEKQELADELRLGARFMGRRYSDDSVSYYLQLPDGNELHLDDDLETSFMHEIKPVIEQELAQWSTSKDYRSYTEVAIRKLLRSKPTSTHNSPETGIALLHDLYGNPCYYRLGVDMHLLVAGTSGSGKGNTLQYLCLEALKFGPKEVQLVVFDAKGGLDYGFLSKIAHATLHYNTAICTENISKGLNEIKQEMARREDILRACGAANNFELEQIKGYKLPWLLVICDEIADYTQEQKSIVETIVRMGRATGVVLVAATQYPTANMLSTQVQANLANRLVFGLAGERYVEVTIGKSAKDCAFNPDVITKETPGVAVFKSNGSEVLGRSKRMDVQTRNAIVAELVRMYPKQAIPNTDTSTNTSTNTKNQPEKPIFGAKIELGTGTGTDTEGFIPMQSDSDLDEEAIKIFLMAGWSKNKIYKYIGGNRPKRFEQFKAIEAKYGIGE